MSRILVVATGGAVAAAVGLRPGDVTGGVGVIRACVITGLTGRLESQWRLMIVFR